MATLPYAAPTSLQEALSLLQQGVWRVVAGATDVYPALGGRPVREAMLDISGVAGLRGIERAGAHWRIGAGTSWSDLLRADLPPGFDALKLAAREVGSIQIQNAATIVGNLCNASPAADGVPPLLILEAEVELSSAARGTRRLPLADFITGVRQTDRAQDELLTALWVPAATAHAPSHFTKLGARTYLVISIVMVAAALAIEQGRITAARIAVGSCSPVAQRLPAVEAALIGQPATAQTLAAACARPDAFAPLSPIDDVRASAAYRLQAAREMTRRTLDILLEPGS